MPVGLSYPLSKHRFCTPSGRATTMFSKVGLKSFVSWTLAPATATLRGPPAASTRMLFLLPALPRSVGLGPIAPPPNALYPWSSPPTAIPSPLRPVPRNPPPGQPRCPPALHTPPNAGKVRWMVLSSPNSLGKWFHWQLLRIRKIMPSSILRWSALLRPLALGGSNSSITGSICSHRSSGTSQIVGSAFPSTTIHLHPSLGTILATTLTH